MKANYLALAWWVSSWSWTYISSVNGKSSRLNYFLRLNVSLEVVSRISIWPKKQARLFQLLRNWRKYQDSSCQIVRVLAFKLWKGEWCQINDIGSCCLFLRSNRTKYLSPVPHGFRPNCIYFTEDSFNFALYYFHQLIRGHDMIVYSTENDKFSPFYEGVSLPSFSPHLLVSLPFIWLHLCVIK